MRDSFINENPIATALPGWHKEIGKANAFLESLSRDMNKTSPFRVDEIALMFKSRHTLFQFIDAAVREEGVVLFNAATDRVRTSPIESKYEVDYYFFNIMHEGIRVEAMSIVEGFSPLHAAMDEQDHTHLPVAVHLSFKTKDLGEYVEAMEEMADSLTLAQECISDYGRFSYFQGEAGPSLYLKPRLNLRDANAVNTLLPGGRDNVGFTPSSEFGGPGVGARAGAGDLAQALKVVPSGRRPISDNPQA